MENLEQIMPSPARETTLQKVLETLERIEEVICFGFHNNQSETSQDDQADFADEREQVQAFSDQRGRIIKTMLTVINGKKKHASNIVKIRKSKREGRKCMIRINGKFEIPIVLYIVDNTRGMTIRSG